MPKKTFLLILFLTTLSGLLIAIAVFSANNFEQSKKITIIPTPTPNPVNATLEISTPELSSKSAKLFSSNILIDTKDIKTDNVQLELAYNPLLLTNIDISTGDYFASPSVILKKIDTKNGRITYYLSDKDGSLGQGTIATLYFNRLATKSANLTIIEILPKSKISSPDYSQSILKSSKNTEF
jgi:hypothetical protein